MYWDWEANTVKIRISNVFNIVKVFLALLKGLSQCLLLFWFFFAGSVWYKMFCVLSMHKELNGKV